MVESNSLQDSLDAAYRYLSYRPRSEGEIRHSLRRRGFAGEVIEKAIARLRELDLSDDLAFAQFWKDNRLTFRPKSKRLIVKELREKKVPAEIIDQVTSDIDDEAVAYRLGYNRMQALNASDYREFYRRLSNYLAYRGFDYATVKRTAAVLWQERQGY